MNPNEADDRWLESMSPMGERSDYKDVWNRQTENLEVASLAVAGFTSEKDMDLTACRFIDDLKHTVGLNSDLLT
jgi:hypothetical protein